ncbi:hypothetical protein ABMA27_009370 [Loxostege sticticalis]|uniref:Sodium/calcium exchanger membrane region domain-containing protein n=1 Tax=Loxostege sticticalis TaxID=481309 RepID=A0ABR3H7R3_LOXSC
MQPTRMRRPRRHRWLTVSVFFIAYSVFQAVLTSSNASEPAEPPVETPDVGEKKNLPIPDVVEEIAKGVNIEEEMLKQKATETQEKGPEKGESEEDTSTERDEEEEDKKTSKDAGYTEDKETTKLRDEESTEASKALIPTVHPLRKDCTPPAIEQHGGLILHILVAVFTFIGLAIVCDEYFVSSLDRICEELQLAPDVAGATFMAAGSSAPELATVVIGVFCAQDDIGVSGVIGSAVFNIMFVISVCALCAGTHWCVRSVPAVFNIMFVISVCALCAGTVSHLNWWPLCRDCFFYALSILPVGPAPDLSPVVSGCCPIGKAGATSPSRRPLCNSSNSNHSSHNMSTKVIHNYNHTYSLTNPFQLAWWFITYPVHWSCRHTMPDCRGRWYPVTFIVSMLWISFYSYFMVWMITIIGYTLGIPDTVMGLTFVAAGVSVPDALSSLAVIKEGYGDMAVSNAVGSNVFDILVCLGLPWFIQTAIIHPGSHVNVISKGLIYSTLSLFSTVVFLVVATHANGWKLDRKFGAVLMVWYLLFITLASLYELNVFGMFNPPDCISSY